MPAMDQPAFLAPTGASVQTIVEAVLRVIGEAPRPRLFSEVIERFRSEEMPERHSTRAAYESMLTRWITPRWGAVPIAEIKTADLESWLKSMECAARTRQHRKALMHALFNAAIRWEMAEQNPAGIARVRSGSRRRSRPYIITIGEFRRVVACLGEPWRHMVLLAGMLGLRASEVVALKWRDIDFKACTLSIERGSVARRVADTKTESSQDLLPLDESLAADLFVYRSTCGKTDPEEWVFRSPVTGGPYHQDSIGKRHLRKAGTAAGLKGTLGWKTFRHSYRRWLDESGTPMGLIKELMRHAHISTTMDVYGVGTLTPAKRGAHERLVAMVRRQD